jgi:predicted metal-binding membrane protein
MVMQLILGVMNIAVMAGIGAIIAVEKLWKRGPLLARLVGGAAIAAGILILSHSI